MNCKSCVEKQRLIEKAYELCQRFVVKVETGRAVSKETYADCRSFLAAVATHERKEASLR